MRMAGLGATISPQVAEASVAKIVAWTSDVRSGEVRKAAQDTLYTLFSLHPSEVTRILNTLPKVCQVRIFISLSYSMQTMLFVFFSLCTLSNSLHIQDSASQIIQAHLNRTMDSSDMPGILESPTSAMASMSISMSSPLRSTSTPQSQPQTPVASQASSVSQYFSRIRPTKSVENDENEHYNQEEVYK